MKKSNPGRDCTKTKQLSTLLDLAKSLFGFAPKIGLLTVSLMITRSLTSGISLLLIIPLLAILGIPVLEEKHSLLTQKLHSVLSFCHVPMNLPGILSVFVLILTIVATACYFEEIIRSKWQEQHQYHLRESIYKLLLHSKWTFLIQKKNSDLLHSITAQLQATWICHFQVLQLINQALLILVYIFLSALLSWKMTLIAAGTAFFGLVLMLPLHKLTAQSGRFFVTGSQALFQVFYEQLNALKMIKSSHVESNCVAGMLEESESLNRKTQQHIKVNALKKWLHSAVNALSFSVLLYIAIEQIKLPAGSLLLLLLVFSRLMPCVTSLQQNWQQLMSHLPSWSDLQQLKQECLANQEQFLFESAEPLQFKRVITFDKVTFSYPSGQSTAVLSNFSLSLEKNTTTVVMGPSGVGKTTVADLLVGLLVPSAGAIYIDKQRLGRENMAGWRQSVAYVSQDIFLFNTSLRKNLQLFCPDATDKDLWQVLAKVKSEEFVRKMDKGLDTIVGDRGTRLSGGERQRIGLARALLMKPQLLLLDESTNALDSEHMRYIQHTLSELHGQLTILIISHQSEMTSIADQVVDLSDKKHFSEKSLVSVNSGNTGTAITAPHGIAYTVTQ